MDNYEAGTGTDEALQADETSDATPQTDGSGHPPEGADAAGSEDSQQLPEGGMPPTEPLTRGQIVEGLVVHIDGQGALVDVGTKSEGHIPMAELSGGQEGKPVEVGDRVAVYVVRPEGEDGNPLLSKKRADYELMWHRITKAHEQGEVLSAMVTDRVKGGLVVDLGLRGFLPASHVRTRNVHALDRFVGQSVKVKIIEIDRGRKRVVVSQKQAIEDARRRRRERTLASIEEMKIYHGTVRRVTDYGAFVDLGGVDGLLHITEMSWTRINHPSDVVKVGGKIDVMVLRYDRERGRVSLGLKQILPDPWSEAESHFRVGDVVAGTVTRVVPFGAFVRLEGGIEGVVPNSELPGGRNQRARDVFSAGDSVQAKIINLRPQERRLTLSARQVEQAREREELKKYLAREQESSRVTIGDLFGSVLAETQAAGQQEETEVSEAAGPAEEAPATEAAERGEAQEVEAAGEAPVEAASEAPVEAASEAPVEAAGEAPEEEAEAGPVESEPEPEEESSEAVSPEPEPPDAPAAADAPEEKEREGPEAGG